MRRYDILFVNTFPTFSAENMQIRLSTYTAIVYTARDTCKTLVSYG